jgi:hypothetical protein
MVIPIWNNHFLHLKKTGVISSGGGGSRPSGSGVPGGGPDGVPASVQPGALNTILWIKVIRLATEK